MGRFGNQIFQWAYAKAYCEQNGYELCIGDWIGDKIFDIPKSRRVDNPDIRLPEHYRQNRESFVYTRSQVRDWLKVKPELLYAMDYLKPDEKRLSHRRVGDYPGTGFPVVSKKSYYEASEKFGYNPAHMGWITEENPTICQSIPKDISFMADFIRMMRCEVLFRGNSTFSLWAGVLGDAKVYAPIVKGIGLVGGKECDVEFVEGNHPACADFDFVDDFRLPVKYLDGILAQTDDKKLVLADTVEELQKSYPSLVGQKVKYYMDGKQPMVEDWDGCQMRIEGLVKI
jgi:hypothetical protein